MLTRWRLLSLAAEVGGRYANGCCKGPVFQVIQLMEGDGITERLAPPPLGGATSRKAWTMRSRGLVSSASRVSRRKQAWCTLSKWTDR